MGKWLVKYFLDQGHEVIISDAKKDEAKAVSETTGAKLANSNIEAAKDADLTVVSTPIDATAQVLREVAAELKEPSTVVEISSIKSRLIPVLAELAKRNMRTLSLHPLFGPGIQKLDGEKIVLIPVADSASEMQVARELFPTAEIVISCADDHDRVMALTLSLPHFMNIVFASVISEEDLNALKKLGGTTFSLQLVTSEGVMSEDPSLYASIQMDNEYASRYLDKFMSKAERLRDYVDRKDSQKFSQFYKDAHDALTKDPDFKKAYERMYKALNSLKKPS